MLDMKRHTAPRGEGQLSCSHHRTSHGVEPADGADKDFGLTSQLIMRSLHETKK